MQVQVKTITYMGCPGKKEKKNNNKKTIQIVFELLSSFTRENLFQGQSTHLTYLFYLICFRYYLY